MHFTGGVPGANPANSSTRMPVSGGACVVMLGKLGPDETMVFVSASHGSFVHASSTSTWWMCG